MSRNTAIDTGCETWKISDLSLSPPNSEIRENLLLSLRHYSPIGFRTIPHLSPYMQAVVKAPSKSEVRDVTFIVKKKDSGTEKKSQLFFYTG